MSRAWTILLIAVAFSKEPIGRPVHHSSLSNLPLAWLPVMHLVACLFYGVSTYIVPDPLHVKVTSQPLVVIVSRIGQDAFTTER